MTTTTEARQGLIDLNALAHSSLLGLWRRFADLSADDIRDALIDTLPLIGEQFGSAAAALAADWYDDLRAEHDVAGRFHAEPASLPKKARYEALARWGVGPLYGANRDTETALSKVAGGMQRIVSDAHRLTIVDSTQRDPRAKGWRRIGVGTNCDFCTMLIGRGGVYTEATVTFRSHDHCNCVASPVWDGRITKISPEPYRQSQRNRSAATKARDNARVRAYIAATK